MTLGTKKFKVHSKGGWCKSAFWTRESPGQIDATSPFVNKQSRCLPLIFNITYIINLF